MRAILRNGLIHPQEPLPEDWSDGTELEVEKAAPSAHAANDDALDRWFAEVEEIASQGDPEDDKRLEIAIQEVRQQQKELARKKLGFAE
jgi:hypothetical protein